MIEPRAKAPHSLARRLAPVVVGIAGAWLFSLVFLPKPVELFLRVPRNASEFLWLDVRVVQDDDGRQVLRARRPHESGARTVVLETKLKEGRFRIEAWPDAPAGTRWSGVVDLRSDSADVELQ